MHSTYLGLLQRRDENVTPPPQLLEQGVNRVQGDHAPSTVRDVCFFTHVP